MRMMSCMQDCTDTNWQGESTGTRLNTHAGSVSKEAELSWRASGLAASHMHRKSTAACEQEADAQPE